MSTMENFLFKNGLRPHTVEMLLREGFESLEDLAMLDEWNISQLGLPMQQALLLKNFVEAFQKNLHAGQQNSDFIQTSRFVQRNLTTKTLHSNYGQQQEAILPARHPDDFLAHNERTGFHRVTQGFPEDRNASMTEIPVTMEPYQHTPQLPSGIQGTFIPVSCESPDSQCSASTLQEIPIMPDEDDLPQSEDFDSQETHGAFRPISSRHAHGRRHSPTGASVTSSLRINLSPLDSSNGNSLERRGATGTRFAGDAASGGQHIRPIPRYYEPPQVPEAVTEETNVPGQHKSETRQEKSEEAFKRQPPESKHDEMKKVDQQMAHQGLLSKPIDGLSPEELEQRRKTFRRRLARTPQHQHENEGADMSQRKIPRSSGKGKSEMDHGHRRAAHETMERQSVDDESDRWSTYEGLHRRRGASSTRSVDTDPGRVASFLSSLRPLSVSESRIPALIVDLARVDCMYVEDGCMYMTPRGAGSRPSSVAALNLMTSKFKDMPNPKHPDHSKPLTSPRGRSKPLGSQSSSQHSSLTRDGKPSQTSQNSSGSRDSHSKYPSLFSPRSLHSSSFKRIQKLDFSRGSPTPDSIPQRHKVEIIYEKET